MAESIGYMVGYIIGALFAGVSSGLLNYYWCDTVHKRPILGGFAAMTSFFCGLAGGFILAAIPTIIFGLCGLIFSKKPKRQKLAPVVPLQLEHSNSEQKLAS